MNILFPTPYVQDEHEVRTRVFFNLPMDFKLSENSFKFTGQVIFICYSNRCGSNYLSELLKHVEDYKVSGEFFNAENFINFFDNKTRDIEEYLFGILKLCELENKIPLFKISWGNILNKK